jgi:citronellol/citronellal dehydrogenase
MDDRQTNKSDLSDDELLVHPTVYAVDALKDQVAVISGGSGGIGRAIAFLFARLGAHVALAGRDRQKLDTLVGRLAANGLKASAHVADIREPASVEALFDAVWSTHGRLDGLINSAGGQFPQAAIDFSIKGWNAVIDTNLNGTWYMMQAAAKHWRNRKQSGHIVNIVVVTTHGLYGIAHSIAARSGVIGLSRAVAVEWAPLDIRVNCVAPGLIETAGWNVYSQEARAVHPRANPMMRVGSPWDIAEACVYLSASSGNYITGETLTIDGGGQLWGETWTTAKPDYFGGTDK